MQLLTASSPRAQPRPAMLIEQREELVNKLRAYCLRWHRAVNGQLRKPPPAEAHPLAAPLTVGLAPRPPTASMRKEAAPVRHAVGRHAERIKSIEGDATNLRKDVSEQTATVRGLKGTIKEVGDGLTAHKRESRRALDARRLNHPTDSVRPRYFRLASTRESTIDNRAPRRFMRSAMVSASSAS